MINGIYTSVLLLIFLAIALWAYSRRPHADFQEAAQLPLEDEAQATKELPACCKGEHP